MEIYRTSDFLPHHRYTYYEWFSQRVRFENCLVGKIVLIDELVQTIGTVFHSQPVIISRNYGFVRFSHPSSIHARYRIMVHRLTDRFHLAICVKKFEHFLETLQLNYLRNLNIFL